MIITRQARAGRKYLFAWFPDPLPATDPVPHLVVPALEFDTALAPLREPATVASVGDDLVTITLAAPGVGSAARGLIGAAGAAWLDLGEAGQFPVRIAAFDSDTVLRLTEALPYAPGEDAAGTISWGVWTVEIPADTIGAATRRALPWHIDWVSIEGEDHPGDVLTDSGVLDVVQRPFDTGVRPEALLTLAPLLATIVPARQRSWAPQVQLAREELMRMIQAALPPGRHVDQVSGEQFACVHAKLAAHLIVMGHRTVGYDPAIGVDLREEALDDFKLQARRWRWLDINNDGATTSGEVGVGTTIGTIGGAWSGTEATELELDR